MAEKSDLEPEAQEPLARSDLAVAAALDEARENPELGDDVRAYFQAQTLLTDQQRHHLTAQFQLELWSKRLKVGLQLFAAIIATAVAVVLILTVWAAAHDHGLVVEAFSVPPDFAQRGLTGRAVAQAVLDRIGDMQARTATVRPADTFANNWSDNLKVEIPETGVSFQELDGTLRERLGHQTRITGEVYRRNDRLAVVVRVGERGAVEFVGAEEELDANLQRAAEALFRQTQPYRYATFLLDNGQLDKARELYLELADGPDPDDRLWSNLRLGVLEFIRGDADLNAARLYVKKALEIDRGVLTARMNMTLIELAQGHNAAALKLTEAGYPHVDPSASDPLSSLNVYQADTLRPSILGDATWTRSLPPASWFRGTPGATTYMLVTLPSAVGHQHPGVVDLLRVDLGPAYAGLLEADQNLARGVAALEDGSPSAMGLLQKVVDRGAKSQQALLALPWLALAKARFGDLAGGQALIDATALDCYPCLIVRGQIAAIRGDRRTAERWLTEAIRQGPDLPQAYAARGEIRLKAHDVVGAFDDARRATKTGRNFADGWKLMGDTLAARGEWRGAAERYERALAVAPTWPALKQAREAARRHLS